MSLKLTVRDDSGKPCPFRADWYLATENGPLWHRIKRVWNDKGTTELDIPPGKVKLTVQRGIFYDAVALDLDVPTGVTTREVVLRRRLDAKKLGWHGGESHMHVLHGKEDSPRKISDGGYMAAGDGLDYLQLAWGWDQSFDWLPAEELNRQCREASTPEATIGWNIESPKCYMSKDDGGKSGNLHCFGHGWTVNLKDNSRGRDFFHTGPNFRIMQEVLRQDGIVGCAHPIRSWFNKGNFVSNWASELPFDFVAGVPYAAVDILNDSPLLFFESERFWYTLLNLGYKVAGTGNSDGALGSTRGLGHYRTYTQIDGAFSWEKLASGMKAGRCIASSGPFVIFELDGQGPGSEFVSDGKTRRATIKAWSAPLPGESLVAVQLVRNGEVVRAWDLHGENPREWETTFELRDSEFSWYCVRVLSTCRNALSQELWGPQLNELAVANPVYFLPSGFERPKPEPARVTLNVIDADSGKQLNATVEIHDGAGVIAREEYAKAERILNAPATASMRISSNGYETAERNLYMDCPELFDFCRNMCALYPSFFSPETFRDLRRRISNLKLSVALKRKD
jgi:hypothetical protein